MRKLLFETLNSEEDIKILKAIIDCNPQWVDDETLTVTSTKPVKELIEQIRKEDMERVVEIVTDLKRSGAELITTPLGFDAWKRDNYFHNLALDEILSIIKQAHGTN